MVRIIFILLFLLFTSTAIQAQSTIIVEVTGVGSQPFDKSNKHLYENRIDANGNLVVEPSIYFTYESYIKKNFVSLQLQQGFYYDAAAQLAGFTQLGYRNRFFHKWKNSISVSVGPTMLYRLDWNNVPGYVTQKGWVVNGKWQVRATIAGEIEYDYFLSKQSDIAVSLTFNYENLGFGLWAGYRFWIHTKVKHNGNCNCGSTHYKKRLKDWFR